MDSVARLPSQIKNGCQMCSTVGHSVTSVQKLVQVLGDEIVWPDILNLTTYRSDIALQTESTVNGETVEALKKDLNEVKQQHETDKKNLTSVIK